jgi:hypothetical protein
MPTAVQPPAPPVPQPYMIHEKRVVPEDVKNFLELKGWVPQWSGTNEMFFTHEKRRPDGWQTHYYEWHEALAIEFMNFMTIDGQPLVQANP